MFQNVAEKPNNGLISQYTLKNNLIPAESKSLLWQST
jgi:hypothetical protein